MNINIISAIYEKRLSLNETQGQFGKRFDVSHASVSDWERGVSEAPYRVIGFVFDLLKPQQTPDEKVLDYLERAETIIKSKGSRWLYGSLGEPKHDHIIEIAKLLQREESK